MAKTMNGELMTKNKQLFEMIDAEVTTRLTGVGQRYPESRQSIVHLLAESAHPLSVPEIEQALSGAVPTSSIYRNLVILEQVRVVNRVTLADGSGRFELDEEVSGEHHHHLICVDCGRVFDVKASPKLEQLLHSAADEVAHSHDFEVLWHNIDLHGKCRDCTKR